MTFPISNFNIILPSCCLLIMPHNFTAVINTDVSNLTIFNRKYLANYSVTSRFKHSWMILFQFETILGCHPPPFRMLNIFR